MGNRELENTIRINLVIVHSNVESITEPRLDQPEDLVSFTGFGFSLLHIQRSNNLPRDSCRPYIV